MARGDVTVFDQFLEDEGLGLHDLENDTIKIGLVTNATVPAANTADPRWGAGGTTNFSTNQVSTGGTSYTGPVDVTGTFSQTAGTATFDLTTNPSWAQDASGPTDIYYGIIYNDTDAGKRCIGFIDLGGPVSLVDGALTVTWNASGFFTKAVV